jgi:hypothetical protein
MRRILGLLVFVLVAGLGLEAPAQTAYPSAPYPQFGQAPTAGPGFDRDRRDRRGRDDIRIMSAWYGLEDRACDATHDVRHLCEGRSWCTIPATNRLCGDPVHGVRKVLTVWYRCERGRPRSSTRWEGTYLGLRCD